jgi:hypothetical protein
MDGAIMIIIGLIILYISLKSRLNSKKIIKTGIQTEGIVFDLVQSSNSESMAKYPVIRFVTEQQQWITKEYNISTIPGLLKKGQKVIIIYDPNSPEDFVIKSSITSVVPLIMISVAVLIIGIGIYKLVIYII